MREIKFRAWDKEKKDWAILGLFLDSAEPEGDFRIDKNLILKVANKNIIIMQYTGLKDKSGKEIYEGDITSIKAENGKINKFIVKFGIAQRTMDSGWLVDIPSFYFDLIGSNFQAFPIVINYKGKHDLEIMKIIGNIYENPELLQ